MKLTDISIVLFVVLFGIIFFPIFSPNIVVTLLPEEKQSIPIHVNQPDVVLKVNHNQEVVLNLTRLDTNEMIFKNISFYEELTFEDLEVGFFVIDVISPHLGDLTINRTGFYSLHLFLFVTIGLINLLLIYRRTI